MKEIRTDGATGSYLFIIFKIKYLTIIKYNFFSGALFFFNIFFK